MKRIKSLFAIILVLVISTNITAFSMENDSLDKILEETAVYLSTIASNPRVDSVGGEWSVIGLARSGYDVGEEYYQRYYKNLERYVKECDGVLHDRKYTEYSRVVLALTAIGKNPENVAGYNLLAPLADYDKVIWQGVNGPVWALIALDSGDYEIPTNAEVKTQATRDMYIAEILKLQNSDGGWSLNSNVDVSDADITGMAIQALSKYLDRNEVKTAVDKALLCISKMQNDDGGFSNWGTENSESCVQMIAALCELGISIEDERFVKNGHTMLDSLMSYYQGNGRFSHTDGSGTDLMATEQGFYALVSVKRQRNNISSLYRMSDHITVEDIASADNENAGDIKNNQKTFDDIKGHKNADAIEALASLGIINGKSENVFDPESTMTRAEFSAVMVRALGLSASGKRIFDDVNESDWFYDVVSAAYENGIVKGISDREFNPNGTITRQEAAVMTARGVKLCGINPQLNSMYVRDTLAGFVDYVKTDEWARESLALCYSEGILPDSEIEIQPQRNVTRAEIAQMLYNMLKRAGKI